LATPTFSVVPSNTANEGDTIIFFCDSESSETATFTWFHNGNKLQDLLGYKIVNNIKPLDGGSYYCEVGHSIVGNKTSQPIHITVHCEYYINYLQCKMYMVLST
jgi:Immunoglobulin I-set domain.